MDAGGTIFSVWSSRYKLATVTVTLVTRSSRVGESVVVVKLRDSVTGVAEVVVVVVVVVGIGCVDVVAAINGVGMGGQLGNHFPVFS